MFNDSSPVKFHRNFLSEKKIQNLHQASAFFFHRLHVTNILSKKCYHLHHFMHTDFTTLHITIRILQTMYQALPDFTVILPTNHKRRCLHCKNTMLVSRLEWKVAIRTSRILFCIVIPLVSLHTFYTFLSSRAVCPYRSLSHLYCFKTLHDDRLTSFSFVATDDD